MHFFVSRPAYVADTVWVRVRLRLTQSEVVMVEERNKARLGRVFPA